MWNEDLRNKSGVRDIIKTIKSKKWRSAGHLARRHDNRRACKTTNWTPRNWTRKRGRQITEDGEMTKYTLWALLGNSAG